MYGLWTLPRGAVVIQIMSCSMVGDVRVFVCLISDLMDMDVADK
jgi:hypothetical protein